MRSRPAGRTRRSVAGALLLAIVPLAACGPDEETPESARRTPSPETAVPSPSATATNGVTSPPSPPSPPSPTAGPLRGPLLTADVLVTSGTTVPDDVVRGLRRIRGVRAVEPLSLGSMSVEGRTLSVAAVDPATYRRFTPVQTAQANDVWARVAGGEVAVDPAIPRRVVGEGDLLALGTDDAEKVHVGAYAPLSKGVTAVVNHHRGAELGLPRGNALLLSTGVFTPSALMKQMREVVDGRAAIDILALEFDNNVQVAVLTGASVPSVVGSFSYTRGPNGTINPDQGWVSEYIRTETVPILGRVTCNKAMIPQLRAALTEVVQRGLAHEIHPDEYAGCFYPRYIGRDPRNGISLHSWGIAVDLNVPGNQRGTVGEMNRQVVEIFKRWGFAWGGDWSYTDPMHFELNRVVEVG